MSTLKVDQLEAATASTITVPSGQTLDISSATLTPPATMPASSAANLTSIPAANITGTIAAVSGANLTALNATQLTSGTVPDDRFPATLPAKSGVNLTALNATNLGSGAVPAARMPVGSILQVVHLERRSGDSLSTSSATYADIDGFTLSITPSSATNKVLVMATVPVYIQQNANDTWSAAAFAIHRGGAIRFYNNSSTGTGHGTNATYDKDHDCNFDAGHLVYLDSPGATTSTAYKIQIAQPYSGTLTASASSCAGTLTLMEVVAS
jgi:hypothetical protein